MKPKFTQSELSSLGFDPNGTWGDECLPLWSIYLGHGMSMHVVEFNEVFLEVDQAIKPLPGVSNAIALASGLLLFGRSVEISRVLSGLNVDTLEVAKGVYDIAPEREEVCEEV